MKMKIDWPQRQLVRTGSYRTNKQFSSHDSLSRRSFEVSASCALRAIGEPWSLMPDHLLRWGWSTEVFSYCTSEVPVSDPRA